MLVDRTMTALAGSSATRRTSINSNVLCAKGLSFSSNCLSMPSGLKDSIHDCDYIWTRSLCSPEAESRHADMTDRGSSSPSQPSLQHLSSGLVAAKRTFAQQPAANGQPHTRFPSLSSPISPFLLPHNKLANSRSPFRTSTQLDPAQLTPPCRLPHSHLALNRTLQSSAPPIVSQRVCFCPDSQSPSIESLRSRNPSTTLSDSF